MFDFVKSVRQSLIQNHMVSKLDSQSSKVPTKDAAPKGAQAYIPFTKEVCVNRKGKFYQQLVEWYIIYKRKQQADDADGSPMVAAAESDANPYHQCKCVSSRYAEIPPPEEEPWTLTDCEKPVEVEKPSECVSESKPEAEIKPVPYNVAEMMKLKVPSRNPYEDANRPKMPAPATPPDLTLLPDYYIQERAAKLAAAKAAEVELYRPDAYGRTHGPLISVEKAKLSPELATMVREHNDFVKATDPVIPELIRLDLSTRQKKCAATSDLPESLEKHMRITMESKSIMNAVYGIDFYCTEYKAFAEKDFIDIEQLVNVLENLKVVLDENEEAQTENAKLIVCAPTRPKQSRPLASEDVEMIGAVASDSELNFVQRRPRDCTPSNPDKDRKCVPIPDFPPPKEAKEEKEKKCKPAEKKEEEEPPEGVYWPDELPENTYTPPEKQKAEKYELLVSGADEEAVKQKKEEEKQRKAEKRQKQADAKAKKEEAEKQKAKDAAAAKNENEAAEEAEKEAAEQAPAEQEEGAEGEEEQAPEEGEEEPEMSEEERQAKEAEEDAEEERRKEEFEKNKKARKKAKEEAKAARVAACEKEELERIKFNRSINREVPTPEEFLQAQKKKRDPHPRVKLLAIKDIPEQNKKFLQAFLKNCMVTKPEKLKEIMMFLKDVGILNTKVNDYLIKMLECAIGCCGKKQIMLQLIKQINKDIIEEEKKAKKEKAVKEAPKKPLVVHTIKRLATKKRPKRDKPVFPTYPDDKPPRNEPGKDTKKSALMKKPTQPRKYEKPPKQVFRATPWSAPPPVEIKEKNPIPPRIRPKPADEAELARERQKQMPVFICNEGVCLTKDGWVARKARLEEEARIAAEEEEKARKKEEAARKKREEKEKKKQRF